MDGWDFALLAMMGYLAVIALVRQMLARRDSLTTEFRQRLAAEKQRRQKQKPAADPK